MKIPNNQIVELEITAYDRDCGTRCNTYKIPYGEAVERIRGILDEPREDPITYGFRIDGRPF